jgi:outer membrane protein OmpA-like peptidoglycan-associated protein
VQATEVHALLPYVFFEEDSAIIPARYYQVDRRGRRTFSIARIPRGNTLRVYQDVMNIIGERLSNNRKANITVTGCTSQFEQDSTLALRRAQAVAGYLTEVWRVAEKRIKVVARGLPENPSLSEVDTVEGARENQRVELSSDDYEILAPVTLADSVYLRPAGIIRFMPPPIDTLDANFWSLDLQIGDSLIKSAAKGFGAPTGPIDVIIQNRRDLDLRNPVTVTGTMIVQDTLFQTIATHYSTPVVMRQEGTFVEARNIVKGHYVDQYNLLLYSFDSAGVFDFSQQSAVIMRDRITPESTVRVIGHTDRIGLPSYNRELSQRRAEVASGLIGIQGAEVTGMGEKALLYDNTQPEGRYYSRTVTVIVETPIPGESGGKEAKQGKQAKINSKPVESQ